MKKDEIIDRSHRRIGALPDELLTALLKAKPPVTTEKAHAYPASLLHQLGPFGEEDIPWDQIKQTHCRVYINIPWCQTKCTYCRYPEAVHIPGAKELREYFSCLDKEFQLYLDKLKVPKIRSEVLYIGGGTPSLLNLEETESLFKLVHQYVSFDREDYLIFEISPSTISKEKMDILKKYGVQRISMGVQSLNSDVLLQCGREKESSDKVESAMKLIKSAGIPQVNIDFMLGLPGQTLEIFVDDLMEIIRLNPSSISFLDMELWPGSLLFEEKGTNDAATWENQLLMTAAYQEMMEQTAYRARRAHYYVTPEELKRPNIKSYFDTRINGFEIGFGARALSHIHNCIYRNFGLKEYVQKMAKNKWPIAQGKLLDETEMLAMKAVRGICETNVIPGAVREMYRKEIEFLRKFDLIDQKQKLTREGALLESEILYLFYPD